MSLRHSTAIRHIVMTDTAGLQADSLLIGNPYNWSERNNRYPTHQPGTLQTFTAVG